jgi:hypothetical protein
MASIHYILTGAVAVALSTSAAGQSSAPAAPANAQAGAAPASQAAPADPATPVPQPRAEDVGSIDGIIKALYDVISGDAGVKRDWNRFRSIFHPNARMIPTGTERSGQITARSVGPEDYIKSFGPYLDREGFHEQELVRHVDAYGNIAQVFSSYAARHKLTDEKPFMRGINSVQLFNDGKRWWVTSITWSQEDAARPLPEAYSKTRR